MTEQLFEDLTDPPQVDVETTLFGDDLLEEEAGPFIAPQMQEPMLVQKALATGDPTNDFDAEMEKSRAMSQELTEGEFRNTVADEHYENIRKQIDQAMSVASDPEDMKLLAQAAIANEQDALFADNTYIMEETMVTRLSMASPKVDERVATDLKAANDLENIISNTIEGATGMDMISLLATDVFIPFNGGQEAWEAMDTVFSSLVDAEPPGAIDKRSATNGEYLKQVRNVLLTATPQQQLHLVKSYLAALEDESTTFGGDPNTAFLADGMRLLLQSTELDRDLKAIMHTLDALFIPGGLIATRAGVGLAKMGISGAGVATNLARAMAKSNRLSSLLRLNRRDLAGDAIARDVTDGTSTTGLAHTDAVSAATTWGDNTVFTQQEAAQNLAPRTRTALHGRVFKRLAKILQSAKLGGHRPEEIESIIRDADQLNRLFQEQNVHSMQLVGDAGTISSKFDIWYTKHNGQSFKSVEEANRFKDDMGWEGSEVVEKEGEILVKRPNAEVSYTLDTLLNMKEDISNVAIFDPVRNVSTFDTLQRAVGVHMTSKINAAYQRVLKPIYKSLSPEGQKRVVRALNEGDHVGREWNISELDGLGVTAEKEIDAYYKFRALRQTSWMHHNSLAVRSAALQGYKTLKFKSQVDLDIQDNVEVAAKLRSVKSLADEFPDQKTIEVLDPVQGGTLRIPVGNLEQLAEQGIRIYEPMLPVKLKKGEKTSRFIMASDEEAHLTEITRLLNHRAGEFSKIYTDNFVMMMGNSKGTKAFATTNSWKNGKAYAGKLNKALKIYKEFVDGKRGFVLNGNRTYQLTDGGKLKQVSRALYDSTLQREISKIIDDSEGFLESIKKGDVDVDTKFVVKRDRESADGEEFMPMSKVRALAGGRSFSGKRSDKGLLSIDGEGGGSWRGNGQAPRKGAVEAMELELEYLSRHASIDLWRETFVERFLMQTAEFLPKRTGNNAADFMNARKIIDKLGTDDIADKLHWLRVHDYITDQIGVMTKTEKHVRRSTEKTATWLEGKSHLKTANAVRNLGKHDPVGFLRGLNYHINLGSFALAQIVVQGSGGLAAISLHPLHGMHAARTYSALRTGVIARNKGASDEVLAVLYKGTRGLGLNVKNFDEFKSMVDELIDSGILDQISRSTLNHDVRGGALNAGTKGNSIVGRMIKAPYNVVVEHGDLPFRVGEEFNRVVAWDIARRMWKKNNPGKDWTAPLSRQAIIREQDKISFGMTNANRHAIQRGLLSIPVQFWQWNFKLWASVLDKRFTTAEKTRLVIGQMGLWGAAGAPFGGETITNLLVEMMGGNPTEAELTSLRNAVSQGSVSWFIDMLTQDEDGNNGLKLALGSRLGSNFDLILELFEDNAAAKDVVFGVSTVGWDRAWEAAHRIMSLFQHDASVANPQTYALLFDALGDITSGWRNTTKLMMAAQMEGYVTDKHGKIAEQLSSAQMVWNAFGIPPTERVEYFRRKDRKVEISKEITEITDGYMQLWLRAFAHRDMDSYKNSMELVDAYYKSLTPPLQFEVKEKALQMLKQNKTLQQKLKEALALYNTASPDELKVK